MSIPLPTTLTIKETKDHKALVVVEPCYPGYGVTVGNSLRRVLLSSIPGAAITAFKIDGVQHEFTSLPFIKEDAVELMLNLKNIRLKSFSSEPVVLNLEVAGEKIATAGDIAKNSLVEIVTPDAPIATLTDKNASLKMELVVKTGTGYVTVEERVKEKVDIGTVIIDAFYTPVLSVSFEIENVRVGDRTDYEKLILKIETDGTITPQAAIKEAGQILVEQFQYVLDNTLTLEKPKKAKKEKEEASAKGGPTSGGKEEEVVETEADEPKEGIAAVSETPEEKTSEDKPKKKRGRPRKTEN